ncbi:MAG: VWA-like domain-containing protein [Limosilactobacillus sp.]|uniref:vWA domain-containing protein n=1 Tax=Limosilactobacillus sp. TaxID=2773925 RepID=UPI0026F678A8|nr:VWA-like domain-containing protein [Limosilactobacillus sp.]
MANQQARLSYLVSQILREKRFLGEILLFLPRKFDTEFEAATGLVWVDNEICLKINPNEFAKLRDDDAILLLEHNALHIAWRHPLRYDDHPDQDLVNIATDVAVNQGLSEDAPGTFSLEWAERYIDADFKEFQDSQVYLNILENLSGEEKQKLRSTMAKQGDGKAKNQPAHESHDQWQSSAKAQRNSRIRQMSFQKLIYNATKSTPYKDRGTIPGSSVSGVSANSGGTTEMWKLLLRREMGKIARGQRDTHARFNRRQPMRMDLPGKVARLVPEITIFVDNSGSITEDELGTTLTHISEMNRMLKIPLTIYSFDAAVHEQGQKVKPGARIKYERIGGGGTSFQAVFDFMQDQKISKRSLVVIITDGWGERKITDHNYNNVYWLLTNRADQLSVDAPGSHVFELKGDY